MKNLLMKSYVWAQIWREDEGQDLIEYALVVALIALAAVSTMGTLAGNINSAFSKVNSGLANAVK